MLQAECGDSFSHATGFIPVDGARLALGHGTKAAAPGADISQQHESCSTVIPALADVGALSRLAHRVQSQTAGQLLKTVKIFADRGLGPEPLRLGLPEGRTQFDLYEWGTGGHRTSILHAGGAIPKAVCRAGSRLRTLRSFLWVLCGKGLIWPIMQKS
jgi:hypothetical protein